MPPEHTQDASALVPVIMAGGRGQRFWPLSTVDRPKQFLDLERSGRTLLQATFDRLLPLAGSVERVFVATGRRYVEVVREQLPDLPVDNVIVEPTGRDSAPAVGLASLTIHERTGGATLGFFASDHRIEDEAAFHAAVRAAMRLAEDHEGLVTLGITPTRAATAYGYIERGERVGPGFRVRRFVEKPNAAKAAAYLADGSFVWTAGIFVWRSDVILAELDALAPQIMVPMRAAVRDGRLDEAFGDLPATSIDYAVMERTERAYVVPVDCGWDDIGGAEPTRIRLAEGIELDVLPSYEPAPNPTELLANWMRPLLDRLRPNYDVIVIDSAPVLPFADTLTVAPHATGVIFTVSVLDADRRNVQNGIQLLKRVGVKVFGTVAANIPAGKRGSGGYRLRRRVRVRLWRRVRCDRGPERAGGEASAFPGVGRAAPSDRRGPRGGSAVRVTLGLGHRDREPSGSYKTSS